MAEKTCFFRLFIYFLFNVIFQAQCFQNVFNVEFSTKHYYSVNMWRILEVPVKIHILFFPY